jgi:hypothetical protein
MLNELERWLVVESRSTKECLQIKMTHVSRSFLLGTCTVTHFHFYSMQRLGELIEADYIRAHQRAVADAA